MWGWRGICTEGEIASSAGTANVKAVERDLGAICHDDLLPLMRSRDSNQVFHLPKSSVLSPLLVFILLRCEQPEKMWRKCQESQVIAAGFIVKWEFLVLGSCSDSVFILMIRSR